MRLNIPDPSTPNERGRRILALPHSGWLSVLNVVGLQCEFVRFGALATTWCTQID